MLLLTRRIHEEIVVIEKETGEQIIVAPVGLCGNQVGIEAPPEVKVLREELTEPSDAA